MTHGYFSKMSHGGMAFIAGLSVLYGGVTHANGNSVEGAKKSQYCATCHGPDGNYTHTGTPRLAGQSEAQFAKKMQAYQSGKRLAHPMMSMLTNGRNNQDVADIGAFYASQKVDNSLKPYQPQKY